MKASRILSFFVTAAMALVLTLSVSAAPVGIYKFNDAKEAVIADLSGSGNDATIDGDYKLVDGKDGKGLLFDGETTGLFLPEAVLMGQEFTFAAWINPQSWLDWARIYDFGAGASGDTWLGYSGLSKKLRLDWFTKNAAIAFIEAPAPALNKWTHVAVTVDAATMKLYVDGRLVGSSDSLGILPEQIPANNFYIGRSNWPDPLFKGRMDEVYIDDEALSEGEIKALMKSLPRT